MSVTPGGAAFLTILWAWLPANLAAPARPNPGLSPGDVIRIVVESLQHSNSPSPNAGIFTVYQFAAPANRAAIGPYGNFVRLVKLPPFGPLFSGHADRYGQLAITGDHAAQAVRFRVAGGGEVWFGFVVSRQTSQQTRGRCAGCWMVDGVVQAPAEP